MRKYELLARAFQDWARYRAESFVPVHTEGITSDWDFLLSALADATLFPLTSSERLHSVVNIVPNCPHLIPGTPSAVSRAANRLAPKAMSRKQQPPELQLPRFPWRSHTIRVQQYWLQPIPERRTVQ